MALDPNARRISIGFPGGSLSAKVGLMKAIFGESLVEQSMQGTEKVSVKAHSRVRVIGGAATQVGATNYDRKKFPKGQRGGAAGGEPIAFFYKGDWWSFRLTGSHQDLNSWLATRPGVGVEPRVWRSEKDTPYGPFKAGGLVN
jgi:hypothetical protein